MAKKLTEVALKATQIAPRNITWAQINLAASEDLRGLIDRNAKAAQLLLALIERMQPGAGGVVVASRTAMAEILGASLRTIDRSVALLADEGWVQKMRIGGAFALAINSRVAWVGPRGNLPHAAFTATVIASRSEQDALALEPLPVRWVPTLQPGDEPLPVGSGQDPPSQPDLTGMPPVVATTSDRAELEAREQLRLGNIDPDTGEIRD